ncbi:MAG: LysE family transporter [Saprospiraceae bacterium]|jgi:threonine/homoserine/homoserine lactone efflux protein|nr:LysE family transporter [Saprospiraceae bacterium]MBL0024547.1 LysE family transporter [Saprospiraceae bacterium]
MQYIADGIMLGLTLTILLGPIFVALTQTGIKHGIKAGIAVGSGIWISDFLIIVACYFFISQLSLIIKTQGFHFWMGLVGGVILLVFGVFSFFKSHKGEEKTPAFNAVSYFGYFSKGFVVNFVNPFSFAFWISVMTSYVSGKAINGVQVIYLFGSILFTIMVTDSLKVIMAKAIRKKMKPGHMEIFGKMAGIMLIVFGIVLIIRTHVF